jgi:hypothetical protein
MSVLPKQRKRTRGGYLPTEVKYRTYSEPPVAPPFDLSGIYSGTPEGKYEVMNDIVTPDFKVRSSQGEIINTSMSYSSETRKYGSSHIDGIQVLNTSNPPATNHTFLTFDGKMGAVMDQQASLNVVEDFSLHHEIRPGFDLSKYRFLAAVNARKKVSPVFVQSLVTLAEMHKTVDMVANVAHTLGALRYALKRNASLDDIYHIMGGKFKVAKVKRKVVDPIYNRWLEYRYGWTPLVMELQGALKALDPTRIPKLRGTARGKAVAEQTETWTRDRFLLQNPQFGTHSYLYQQKNTVEARSYVMFETQPEFQTARDFGLTEVPLAMWELVPYSFVVDWFIPIGDWLEAVTPKLGVTVLAEGVVTKHTRLLSRLVTDWIPSTDTQNRWQISGYENNQDTLTKFDRVRTPNLAQSLAYPKFDVKINVKRALDAIALLGLGSKLSVVSTTSRL